MSDINISFPYNIVFLAREGVMKIIVQKSENAIKTFHLLSNLTIKNIISFLKENSPCSPSRIARELNISPSVASKWLNEMRKYNIVNARWKTTSVEERPLKLYSLVPNVLRFEFVLNEPRVDRIKPEQRLSFRGEGIAEFKDGDRKGIYASLESMAFRFDGATAIILKEVSKGGYTLQELRVKFEGVEEFDSSFRHLFTLGLIGIEQEK